MPSADVPLLLPRLTRIRLLAMDVDGVLTDGTIGYDGAGNRIKHFDISDGLGLVVLRQCGVAVAWITGREDPAVMSRAIELGIPVVRSGVRDKEAALRGLASEMRLDPAEIAYIGDDWNDLPAFRAAGVRFAVANAAAELRAAADYECANAGGHGAVREICNLILEAQGGRQRHIDEYLIRLRSSDGSDAAQ